MIFYKFVANTDVLNTFWNF